MNPNFNNLSTERQDQILNGAMAVFSRHSYEKAGTDEICQAAGISKGLLYHYFSNKKTLCLALYERGVELVVRQLERDVSKGETDLFEILNLAVRSKLALLSRHPALFGFLLRCHQDQSPELAQDMARIRQAQQSSGAASLFQNLDRQKLKPGLDMPKLLELLTWMSEGFVKKHPDMLIEHSEQILESFQGYMAIFRQAVYREEFL